DWSFLRLLRDLWDAASPCQEQIARKQPRSRSGRHPNLTGGAGTPTRTEMTASGDRLRFRMEYLPDGSVADRYSGNPVPVSDLSSDLLTQPRHYEIAGCSASTRYTVARLTPGVGR